MKSTDRQHSTSSDGALVLRSSRKNCKTDDKRALGQLNWTVHSLKVRLGESDSVHIDEARSMILNPDLAASGGPAQIKINHLHQERIDHKVSARHNTT